MENVSSSKGRCKGEDAYILRKTSERNTFQDRPRGGEGKMYDSWSSQIPVQFISWGAAPVKPKLHHDEQFNEVGAQHFHLMTSL